MQIDARAGPDGQNTHQSKQARWAGKASMGHHHHDNGPSPNSLPSIHRHRPTNPMHRRLLVYSSDVCANTSLVWRGGCIASRQPPLSAQPKQQNARSSLRQDKEDTGGLP